MPKRQRAISSESESSSSLVAADSASPTRDGSGTQDTKPIIKKHKQQQQADGTTPRGKGKPWSPQEDVLLFKHVLAHGKTAWEDAVPGRTKNQARQAWKNRLEKEIVGLLLKKSGGQV